MAASYQGLDHVALYKAAKATDDGTRIPAEAVDAELDGVHPIKAWAINVLYQFHKR
ncbi:hypothetical protein C8R31_101364 [Nitrosospira sp. Nsp2]|uniref:hypothetical protein n=1 Tax=Nitrosospira sp. Nsp2 TaxID=136548 RepID=UPI000D4034E1|nr:hypothetical protein [Nitrosospira sp. Nsp2]PTR17205.1 hypothetical protein C8R31_101364 [Nitrosospira sp. Nsp2]